MYCEAFNKAPAPDPDPTPVPEDSSRCSTAMIIEGTWRSYVQERMKSRKASQMRGGNGMRYAYMTYMVVAKGNSVRAMRVL